MREGGTEERPAIFFDDAAEFRTWLEANHEDAGELWMGLHKKHVQPQGLTWEQAVRVALCFGWIDSISQRIDDDSRRQRWTPRRAGSIWSLVNVKHVEELTAAGLMHPAGLAAFEARRADRTGIYSHENPNRELPSEYAAQLAADPRASRFWAGATASYRRAAIAWVLSAKQEATRERRMAELVADCSAGRLVKPQRYGTEPVWVARLREDLG